MRAYILIQRGFLSFLHLITFSSIFIFFFHPSVLAKNTRSQHEIIQALEKQTLAQENFPEVHRQKLENGLELLALKDDEFPVVRGFIYIRVGSIYEAADKVGLSEMLGELLRSGGSQQTPADQIDEFLDSLGASIVTDFDRESGKLSFTCLKEDFPQVLRIVFEILKTPAFEEDKLELTRLKMLEALRRQNDQSSRLAQREFSKMLYGKDNIWSRTPSKNSIQNISRQDLLDFHRRFFGPNRIIMGLAGDFSLEHALEQIKKESQNWKPIQEALPKLPTLQKTWNTQRKIFPKKTDQASIIMGHYGDKRFNPDKFSLLVMNSMLGGDLWTSRLGKRIRSTLGLAYGVYSHFGLESDYGLFRIFAQTKTASAKQLIDESQKILKKVASGKDFSQQELDLHKESILNSLYAEYDPPYNFLKNEVRFKYFGYPPSYLKIFREKIRQVSLQDVQKVAQQYLKPEKISILIVGKQEELKKIANFSIIEK